jgi:hypothetical protein
MTVILLVILLVIVIPTNRLKLTQFEEDILPECEISKLLTCHVFILASSCCLNYFATSQLPCFDCTHCHET